jgi:hypothetical protein
VSCQFWDVHDPAKLISTVNNASPNIVSSFAIAITLLLFDYSKTQTQKQDNHKNRSLIPIKAKKKLVVIHLGVLYNTFRNQNTVKEIFS